MKTSEEKTETIRKQVIAKIHWDAREQEVREWLEEQHGITDADADQLLADAYRAKRRAVREHSLVRLIFSLIGMALVAGFFYVRYFNGMIFYGTWAWIATGLAVSIGGTSVVTFFRSLARLVTGEAPVVVE